MKDERLIELARKAPQNYGGSLLRIVDNQQARIAELESAIKWALGEEGEFGGETPEKGRYWWRTELRKRAGL